MSSLSVLSASVLGDKIHDLVDQKKIPKDLLQYAPRRPVLWINMCCTQLYVSYIGTFHITMIKHAMIGHDTDNPNIWRSTEETTTFKMKFKTLEKTNDFIRMFINGTFERTQAINRQYYMIHFLLKDSEEGHMIISDTVRVENNSLSYEDLLDDYLDLIINTEIESVDHKVEDRGILRDDDSDDE